MQMQPNMYAEPMAWPNSIQGMEMPMMENMMCRNTYPEIYYKLQPFIMMACDQMEVCGPQMPTQEMVENMCDHIHTQVCHMHPEIAEYAQKCDNDPGDDPDPPAGFRFGGFERGMDRMGFGFPFRRRGPFRDLISILLLSELFRRRRRFF